MFEEVSIPALRSVIIGGQVPQPRLAERASIADIEGGRVETVVTGTRSDLSTFDIAEPIPTSDDTGTTVRIEHVTEAAARALDKGTVIDGLAITFALYLESYPVAISWRGDRLDPSELQQFRQTYALDVPGVDGQVALTVIEWTRSVPRAMLLCDGNGMALHEVRPGVQAPGFDFTAYVRWSGFAELGHDLLLAELGHQQVTPVVEAAQTEPFRRVWRANGLSAPVLVGSGVDGSARSPVRRVGCLRWRCVAGGG